jgi:hypothetical protein
MDYSSDMSNMDMSTPMAAMDAGQSAAVAGFMGVFGIVMLLVSVLGIVMLWRIFAKAGQAGWKSIIPIYNAYVLLQIVGRPGWWLLLSLIPVVNIIVAIVVTIDLGKSFGKSEVFSIIMLLLLSPIGMAILAFGGDKYLGPRGLQANQPAAPAEPSPPAAPPAGAAPAV